jgi:hypothetical protein
VCAAVPQTFVTLDPVAAAAVAKLRHVTDDAPGITWHLGARGTLTANPIAGLNQRTNATLPNQSAGGRR